MSVAIIQQWLGMQCRMIPGIRSGIIRLENKEQAASSITVSWPESDRSLPARMLQAAQTSLEQHKPFIQSHGDANHAKNPGTILATPVQIRGLPPGAAVLDCAPLDMETGRATLQSFINSLPHLDQLLNPQFHGQSRELKSLELITRMLATALTESDLQSSITALSTELATGFKCDQVAFGLWKNTSTQVIGLSHHSGITQHQALIKEIADLMDEAIDQQAISSYPTNALTKTHIHLIHRDFSRRHAGHAVCTIPLFHAQQPVGALTFIHSEKKPFTVGTMERLEHLACFLAPIIAMQNALAQPWYQQIFGAVKSALKGLRRGEHKWLWALAIAGGLFAAFGTVYHVPFQVTAKARIEGAIQRTVTAPTEGYLKQVFVQPGDRVQQGQPLVELDDRDLQIEKRKLESEIKQHQSSYSAALASRDRAKMAIANAKIAETKAYLDLVDQQLSRIHLTAPFTGIVIDGDLTQSLGAPVKTGDTLLTLAPVNDYRVITEISERDIRFIDSGEQGELMLSANPGERLPIVIEKINPMAKVIDGQNSFEARAQVSPEHHLGLRPGLVGYARIRVDERPLLWVMGRESLAWLKLQIWKWTGRS